VDRDFEALAGFIDSRLAMPHDWGSDANDCASFVLGAVEAATGERRAADLSWSTQREVIAVVRRFGSLEAAFDAYFDRIAPALAQRGDIAGVPDRHFGIHPMIVEGELLVGPGVRGNHRVKRAAMVIAWSAEKKVAAGE
jgi:hypothetical protein